MAQIPAQTAIDPAVAVDNTRALGAVLSLNYVFPFQVSGLILLVAMIRGD